MRFDRLSESYYSCKLPWIWSWRQFKHIGGKWYVINKLHTRAFGGNVMYTELNGTILAAKLQEAAPKQSNASINVCL